MKEIKLTYPIVNSDLSRICKIRLCETARRLYKNGFDTVFNTLLIWNPETKQYEGDEYCEEHYDDHVRKMGVISKNRKYSKSGILNLIKVILDEDNPMYKYRNKDMEIYVTYCDEDMKGYNVKKCCLKNKKTAKRSTFPKLNVEGMF